MTVSDSWEDGRRRAIILFVLLLSIGTSASSELVLSDQESEVYYQLALVAGGRLQVEKNTDVVGNLHANGEVLVKQQARIRGDVSAVDGVQSQAEVTGSVTEGADTLALPRLLDAADLLALADRVYDKDTSFTETVIDDVVFVDGQVDIVGRLDGDGTIIATGDIRLREGAPSPGETTRISLISLQDIRLDKNRHFRGVLRAGRDVMLEMSVGFEGVIVADRNLHVKKDSVVTFVDFDQVAPEISILAPGSGSFVANAKPEISVAFDDDFSGLRLASVELLVDGADRTGEAVIRDDGLTLTPFLETVENGELDMGEIEFEPKPSVVTLMEGTAVPVEAEARNVPPGTVVKLHMFSENAPDQDIDSTPLVGTPGLSTATAMVEIPPGFPDLLCESPSSHESVRFQESSSVPAPPHRSRTCDTRWTRS